MPPTSMLDVSSPRSGNPQNGAPQQPYSSMLDINPPQRNQQQTGVIQQQAYAHGANGYSKGYSNTNSPLPPTPVSPTHNLAHRPANNTTPHDGSDSPARHTSMSASEIRNFISMRQALWSSLLHTQPPSALLTPSLKHQLSKGLAVLQSSGTLLEYANEVKLSAKLLDLDQTINAHWRRVMEHPTLFAGVRYYIAEVIELTCMVAVWVYFEGDRAQLDVTERRGHARRVSEQVDGSPEDVGLERVTVTEEMRNLAFEEMGIDTAGRKRLLDLFDNFGTVGPVFEDDILIRAKLKGYAERKDWTRMKEALDTDQAVIHKILAQGEDLGIALETGDAAAMQAVVTQGINHLRQNYLTKAKMYPKENTVSGTKSAAEEVRTRDKLAQKFSKLKFSRRK